MVKGLALALCLHRVVREDEESGIVKLQLTLQTGREDDRVLVMEELKYEGGRWSSLRASGRCHAVSPLN